MKNSLEIIIKRVRLMRAAEKRRQNQSGGVSFEANCFKQMGHHKKIFHQMFLCLHEGRQRFVSASDA